MVSIIDVTTDLLAPPHPTPTTSCHTHTKNTPKLHAHKHFTHSQHTHTSRHTGTTHSTTTHTTHAPTPRRRISTKHTHTPCIAANPGREIEPGRVAVSRSPPRPHARPTPHPWRCRCHGEACSSPLRCLQCACRTRRPSSLAVRRALRSGAAAHSTREGGARTRMRCR